MANYSDQTVVFHDVRVTKSTGANGQIFGGVYFPACTKNGKPNRARFEATIAINNKPYTDAAGVAHEEKPTYIRIVAFNGKDAVAGHGFADVLAKALSPGKEITVFGELKGYDKRLFANNQPVVDAAGNQITHQAHQLILDKVKFKDDSAAVIAAEIAAYAGQMNFTSRPQFWNVAGHVDNTTWKAIAAWRSAQAWKGETTYGYARIIIPEGAVVTPVPGMIQQPVAGALPTDAAAQLAALAANPGMMALLAQLQTPALTPEQKALADAKALIAKMAAAGNGEDVPF